MDFDEALARTTNLLERQGFATYRTLKRRFRLDDATLAALRTALVDTQHLAADDAGTRLVWLGDLRPGTGPTRLDDEDAPPVASSSLPAPGHRPWTPLVGREAEVALLQACWTPVRAGQGQVVLLGGEAGVGKSRLVQVVKAQVAEQPHQCWECRCDPALQHSAFAPIIELLQRGLHLQPEAAPAAKLPQLEAALAPWGLALAEVVPLLASLLSVPLDARYTLPALSPAQQKQQTLAAIGTLLQALAVQAPVLCIVEDLHWADPSTLELLTLLVARVQVLRCYLLLTHRPEFQAPWAPPTHSTTLTLRRLGPAPAAALVTQVAGGKALPATVLEQILTRTDGVPLFVEEVTQMVLESGLLAAHEDAYVLTGPLPALAIPGTVQESVRARLASLGTAAQHVAQVAAVWGRAVTEAQLQATVGLEGRRLDRAAGRLVAADILYELSLPPRLTYVFKHALIQDVAYAMIPDDRQRILHAQIAQCLVAREPEAVAMQPERVAQHYTAAGCTEQAVDYWQRAGQHASDRSAHLEAISHVTTGIELLETLPETAVRTQHALALYSALGAALQITKGHTAPEVEHPYAQAYALCQQIGETPQLIPVLLGLWRFYVVRPQLHTAREIGETLLRLAQRAADPALMVIAHYTLGVAWLWLGALPAARQHLEEGIAYYMPDQRRAPVFRMGQDLGVACRVNVATALWLLGYPEQALARLHEALALAHELSHPYSLACARCFAAFISQFLRDVAAVHEHAEATITLSTEQRFPFWAARGTSLRGWVLSMQGQGEAAMAQVRQGNTAWRATGAALTVPFSCTLLAEVSAHLGHIEAGLQALTEAYTHVEQQEERWWEAEVSRLRGVLLLRQTGTPQAEAETCFQRSLDVARRQEAKSLELRAAVSLSRLWQQQGKRAEARALLAPIYGWFTEGFDTADLQEAKTLLEELQG